MNTIGSRVSVMKFFALISVIFITGCQKDKKVIQPDPAFAKYIEAYTSGTISKTSAIRIRLTTGFSKTHVVGEILGKSYFDFSPSIKGKSFWDDARTIEFRPEEQLKAGELYTATFFLDKLVDTDPGLEEFKFSFKTVASSFVITPFGLRSLRDREKMTFTGTLETSDAEDKADVEKLIDATLDGKLVGIQWQHSSDNKNHSFTITDIVRGENQKHLTLSWDGKPIRSDIKGRDEIEVPAIGDFKVLNILPGNDSRPYASVLFSSILATDQELAGLITLQDQEDVSYTINGSEVKLYVSDNLDGNYTINVIPGIRNIYGDTLAKGFTANVFFENRLPSVTIEGRGNILPGSGGLTLPFQTINLNAVDVSIIKIYENNIPQFLQTNILSGEEDLRRVAVPVVQRTVRLDDDKTLDLRKKQSFSLDINQYTHTEPGAIYRITIGFRPEYSLYDCRFEKTESNRDEDEEYDEYYQQTSYGSDENDAFWQNYNDYYPFGFVWRDRDNPCAKSYFNKDRWAVRNIIASNIGLIAKAAEGNSIIIAAADLLTAKPIANLGLKVLDFQNQVLANANTDNEGFAHFNLKNKPQLVIATRENERGYLRLDDGSSLPLTRFEVSGEETKQGLKAFIFGERGVWRPGDSLFLSCIVEDAGGKLPAGHPVELQLYNPQGMLYKKMIQKNAESGFNVFRLATEDNVPTGNWSAKVKIGGATFDKRLKIETVMPNRLKVNLDFGDDAILSKNNVQPGTLTAKWLFGADAKNLKATIDASIYNKNDPFPGWKGYAFSNPVLRWKSTSLSVYRGELNAKGVATVQPSFKDISQAPGMLTANLLVKVFEPGGNFSVDNVSLPLSPFSSYAGLKLPEVQKPWGFLLTGKKQTVDIVNVLENGKALAGQQEVEVQLYKVQWRWWWDDSRDDISNFTTDKYNKLLSTEKVNLNTGKGTWSFTVGDHEWGRYLILVKDLKSGHVAGEVFYVDSPYWQNRDNMNDPTAAAMLSFTSDKEKYNVGDNIVLTIPSSEGGRALVSLETGSTVLKRWWVNTDKGQTIVKMKAEAEMSPNVYVNITMIQPHAQTQNDLPIRMYGVLPLLVTDKNSVLKPVINMPNSIRPEVPVSVTVSEEQGRPMTYSIAIVDEGLLDLTRFKTPNPHDYFYAKEALGIKTWDLYDFVIGAWGSRLERVLSIGGDQEGDGQSKPIQANRFKPVVKYLGPFLLNKNQKAKHQFKLPAYIGSVRVMVIAAEDGSYGISEKAVAVKKPLMLLATVPRVLAPGETIKIPVTVFAMEKNIRNVNVGLQTTPNLKVTGATNQAISFSESGEQMINFNVQVTPNTGIGKLKLLATSGNEKAAYEVELNIRNPNPFVTTVAGKDIAKGQQWSTTATPIGTLSTSTATLEVSTIPSIDLEKRLGYLVTYPHGCIEQITSAAYPQLVLNQLTDLTDARKADINRNIRAAIASLQNFQNIDGGFTYWPGNRESDEWGTNYAGNFLLEAKERGYIVSEPMLQQWKLFQRSKANAWYPGTTNFYGGDLTQSYRLYLLALAKSPEIGAMNRLKEFKYLSPEAKWRLAAAYKLAGQENIALQLVSALPTGFGPRKYPGITYGSETRDEAMVLETLTLLGRRTAAFAVLEKIAGVLDDEKWLSTQTIGYSLVAIAKYCGQNNADKKINAEIRVADAGRTISSSSYVQQVSIDVSKGNVPVEVINKGNNILFTRIIMRGQPVTGENGAFKNNTANLSMTVQYFDRNKQPINIASLNQGTDFVAKVTVRNPGNRGRYERMALNQVFPSGWEIINTRLFESEGGFTSSTAEYQDIRDDRVYTYFDLKPTESKTFYVQLNAAYLGRYFLPATYSEAMYDHSISAGINGKWVEVTSPR